MKTKKPKLYWHIHHELLLEDAVKPVSERRDYIRRRKPEIEVPTRLKCLKPVKRPDLIPAALRKKLQGICGEYFEGHDILRRTNLRHLKVLMARHRKEYPKCTCDEHGHLVFPAE